jgi:hypothetical protein
VFNKQHSYLLRHRLTKEQGIADKPFPHVIIRMIGTNVFWTCMSKDYQGVNYSITRYSARLRAGRSGF